MKALFQPLQIGELTLANRLFMAPLTRGRAEPGHVPGDLMATYYAQRASAGLIIAEATMAMEGHSAFWKEPGIYSAAQVAGWRKTTDAVHAAGGKIFLQIWHGGRACHPLLNDGAQPVAPSALTIDGTLYTQEGKKPYVLPRELRDDELPGIVDGFRQAAVNAKAAGFDGVEVHGANGYLLDAFLRDGSNQRKGAYGGAIENRARLMLEVIAAVCEVWGSKRVGLRLSPLNGFNSMRDSDAIALMTYLATQLNKFDLAYLHVMRGDFLGQQTGDVLAVARKHYQGILVGNMSYSGEEADQAIANGTLDAVAFGVGFLANPDFTTRIKTGAAMNTPDPSTFYSEGAKGYTDYPTLSG